jgi:hypothetical protein
MTRCAAPASLEKAGCARHFITGTALAFARARHLEVPRTGAHKGIDMNVIYNSDNYYVVEYPTEHGYELVDKHAARGTYLQGDTADKFLQSMKTAISEDASAEHVDEFLDKFDALLTLPVVFH